MHPFEYHLAVIAQKCDFAYGFSGRAGFVYASAKDHTRWHGLKPRRWLYTVMRIGDYLALDDDTWKKEKLKLKDQAPADLSAMLIAAFGDGKKT